MPGTQGKHCGYLGMLPPFRVACASLSVHGLQLPSLFLTVLGPHDLLGGAVTEYEPDAAPEPPSLGGAVAEYEDDGGDGLLDPGP